MKKFLPFLALVILFSCGDDDEPTFEEQLAIDSEIIDDYIQTNGIAGVQIDPSALRYVIEQEGFGSNPTVDNEITVQYRGIKLDGTVFADTSQTLVLNTAIQGWQIGIPLVKVGGSITMYTQSGYAWGKLGQQPQGIGPNENLIFDVSLVSINR